MVGRMRPVSEQLGVAADGRARGTICLTQSAWRGGIKPYRGLRARRSPVTSWRS
jgi:hypothetical protein